MNITPKWLRGLLAAMMLGAVSMTAAVGCAEQDTGGGESLEADAGSDDIGAGGVETP